MGGGEGQRAEIRQPGGPAPGCHRAGGFRPNGAGFPALELDAPGRRSSPPWGWVGNGMENPKESTNAFWCCVAASFLALYVAAYGFLRWQDALIHDVRIWTAPNGVSYSGYGVRDNPYVDDRKAWHVCVGQPA